MRGVVVVVGGGWWVVVWRKNLQTNKLNSVVNVRVHLVAAVENTAFVQVPLRSINRDSNGLRSNSRHQAVSLIGRKNFVILEKRKGVRKKDNE